MKRLANSPAPSCLSLPHPPGFPPTCSGVWHASQNDRIVELWPSKRSGIEFCDCKAGRMIELVQDHPQYCEIVQLAVEHARAEGDLYGPITTPPSDTTVLPPDGWTAEDMPTDLALERLWTGPVAFVIDPTRRCHWEDSAGDLRQLSEIPDYLAEAPARTAPDRFSWNTRLYWRADNRAPFVLAEVVSGSMSQGPGSVQLELTILSDWGYGCDQYRFNFDRRDNVWAITDKEDTGLRC